MILESSHSKGDRFRGKVKEALAHPFPSISFTLFIRSDLTKGSVLTVAPVRTLNKTPWAPGSREASS